MQDCLKLKINKCFVGSFPYCEVYLLYRKPFSFRLASNQSTSEWNKKRESHSLQNIICDHTYNLTCAHGEHVRQRVPSNFSFQNSGLKIFKFLISFPGSFSQASEKQHHIEMTKI